MPSTAEEEQAWNAQQLAEPVTAPRFAVWTYEAPAVVLGCSQRSELAALQTRAPQIPALVRASGGGAVLTGPWMVSSSVVVPLSHPWVAPRINDSYQPLAELYVRLLAPLGVEAAGVPPAEVPGMDARLGPKIAWSCYGSLGAWEVVDRGRGRKLVGLAQRRQRHGMLLVAGTLVQTPDWPLLCAALGHAEDAQAMRGRTVSCRELARAFVSAADYAERLAAALAAALD